MVAIVHVSLGEGDTGEACGAELHQICTKDTGESRKVVPFAVFYMHLPVKSDYVWAGFYLLGAVYFIFRS